MTVPAWPAFGSVWVYCSSSPTIREVSVRKVPQDATLWTIEGGIDCKWKRSLLAQRRESGGRNEIAVEIPKLAAARHPDIAGPQPVEESVVRHRLSVVGPHAAEPRPVPLHPEGRLR